MGVQLQATEEKLEELNKIEIATQESFLMIWQPKMETYQKGKGVQIVKMKYTATA